ncbi:MAG: EamA family transporter [bacterium]|nr:EamA family transporter [bacterium]
MIPTWVILAALAGLGSNIFATFSRYFLKDKDDATLWAWFFETGRLFVFGLVLLFDFSIRLEIKTILLLLLVGLTELGGDYFTMKMHAYTHLSISTIISRTRMIWIPIIAFFLLRESLHLTDYIGIAILFAGVSITVAPHKFLIDKGAKFANIGALILAFNTVILQALIPYASYSLIVASSAVPSVIFFPFVMRDPKKSIINFVKTKFWLKSFVVLAHVVSIYFFLAALKIGDVSRVNAIYQGMMVTSVFFGIIFFKERQDIVKKIIGAAVTIVGIILVTQN